jgi:hypothetical protein
MARKTISIESTGHLAASCQAPVSAIERAAKSIGLDPTYRINGVAHYTDDDGDQIVAELVRAGQLAPAEVHVNE